MDLEEPRPGPASTASRVVMLCLLVGLGGGVKMLTVFPLAYLAYLGFLWSVQIHMLFPVVGLKQQEQSTPPEGCKVCWVGDTEGSSESWFFEAAVPNGGKAGTVCMFHGNGDTISSFTPLARWFNEQGFHVLIPEYRGYGRSEGTPVEAAIVEDVLKHIQGLAHGFESFSLDNLIYFGMSVGGGIASAVAARRPPQALILLSTFYSIPKLSVQYGVPEFISRGLLHNIYDNKTNIKKVMDKHNVQVFLAHGTKVCQKRV